MKQKNFDFIKEMLSGCYYLSGWNFIIYTYFMKNIYPKWEKGIKEHISLVEQGCVAHIDKGCPYCDQLS